MQAFCRERMATCAARQILREIPRTNMQHYNAKAARPSEANARANAAEQHDRAGTMPFGLRQRTRKLPKFICADQGGECIARLFVYFNWNTFRVK